MIIGKVWILVSMVMLFTLPALAGDQSQDKGVDGVSDLKQLDPDQSGTFHRTAL
jgi:hypothetical protein